MTTVQIQQELCKKDSTVQICLYLHLCVFQHDLIEWLHLLGLGMYHETLAGQGYDDIEYVTDITWEDLEEIGIKKLGKHIPFLHRGGHDVFIFLYQSD